MTHIQIILKEKLKRSRWAPVLRAFYFVFSSPKEFIALFFDFIQTCYESRPLRESLKGNKKNITVNSKKILLVSFGTVYSTKLESILVSPMMLGGCSVLVFIRNRGTFLQRLYYRCFGIRKIIYGAEIGVEMPSRNEIEAVKSKLLAACKSICDLKDFEYRGINIGITLITTIQREELIANFDPSTPDNQKKILYKLNEVIRWVLVCEQLISLEKPDVILMIEANDWNRPLVDVAINRKVDVIQMIQPNEDDGLIFKRINSETRGMHPNSISKETLAKPLVDLDWERQLQDQFRKRYDGYWLLQSRNQPNVVKVDHAYINRELQLDVNKKNAIIFSHILWDANLFYGKDLFEGYADWLSCTIREAVNNTQVNWILKLHPANLWKRKFENVKGEYSEISLLKEQNLWPLPNHIKLLYPDSKISTDSLFVIADYGVTVRGTVGVELPCFGVKTFTAGSGRYSGLGFTEDFNEKRDYLEALQNIHKYPPLDEGGVSLAKKHAYLLFCKRSWKFTSFKVNQGNLTEKNPLAYNIKLNKDFFKKKIESPELRVWMAWFLDPSKPVEYLKDYVE